MATCDKLKDGSEVFIRRLRKHDDRRSLDFFSDSVGQVAA